MFLGLHAGIQQKVALFVHRFHASSRAGTASGFSRNVGAATGERGLGMCLRD